MSIPVTERHESAASELGERFSKRSPEAVVESLSTGLTTLRHLLITRLHEDVESYFGVDSMLAPLSMEQERRELHRANLEAEIYSIVVAEDEIRQSQYLDDPQWTVGWLQRLRLGDEHAKAVQKRLKEYRKRDIIERRRLFSSLIEHALPEAMKAPLVIFRMYPRAIRVAVAVAFGDPLRAAEIRNGQASLLPAIADCHRCHGRPLESGETCRECGNPLWKIRWLCATD